MRHDRREEGLLAVLCGFLRECSAESSDIGIVWQRSCILDVNVSLAQWKHGTRRLARIWWASKAAVGLGDLCCLNWTTLDRMLGKPREIITKVATLVTRNFCDRGASKVWSLGIVFLGIVMEFALDVENGTVSCIDFSGVRPQKGLEGRTD